MRIPVRTIKLMLAAGGLLAASSSIALADEKPADTAKVESKSPAKSKKSSKKEPKSQQPGIAETKPEPKKESETKPRAEGTPHPMKDPCLACGRG